MTDFISPKFAVAAIMACLLSRERDGKGSYIDLAQIECAMRLVEDRITAFQQRSGGTERAGDSSIRPAFECVVGTAEVERHIAISLETPEQRHGVTSLIPTIRQFEATGDWSPLRSAIEAWASRQEAASAVRQLLDVGVPASVVAWPTEVLTDPRLLGRGFFVQLEHGLGGQTTHEGHPTLFSATPPIVTRSPRLGEHTGEVLANELGLSSEGIAELAADGALT